MTTEEIHEIRVRSWKEHYFDKLTVEEKVALYRVFHPFFECFD